MTQNILVTSIKYVLIDLFGDIVYWPIWWYTKGLAKVAKYCWQKIKEEEERLALRLWLLNLFKPMFAQYDWQGRIISFFMRIFVLIFRLIMFIIWSALVLILLVVWLLLPLFIIYQIWANFIFLIR